VAVFATTDFIQLIGSLFYPSCLLRWKSIWHHYQCVEGSLRGESNIGLPCLRILETIIWETPLVAATKKGGASDELT